MATHSREIPRDEWGRMFGEISRHCRGRIVDIELFDTDMGIQALARRLPFVGITAEKTDQGTLTIQVSAGDPEAGHVMHVTSMPSHVWIKQDMNGEDNAMEIESTAGPTLLIEFARAEEHGSATAWRLYAGR